MMQKQAKSLNKYTKSDTKGLAVIEASQLRAARALVNLSQQQLAEKTGLSVQTIKRMETLGLGRSSMENVQAVIDALQDEGVIFIPANGEGAGVRLAKSKGDATV